MVTALVRRLIKEGWRRGVVGDSPAWTAVGGLAVMAYLAGRAWKQEADVVFSEKLLPGQALRIVHEAEPR
jgi:hypothetical protein